MGNKHQLRATHSTSVCLGKTTTFLIFTWRAAGFNLITKRLWGAPDKTSSGNRWLTTSYVCMSCHNDTDAYAQTVEWEMRGTHRRTDRHPREECKSAASTGLIPPPSVPSCMPAVQNNDTAPPKTPANDCSAHYTHIHTLLMLIYLDTIFTSVQDWTRQKNN